MISAVLTPCSARKRKLSSPSLEAARQSVGPQVAVAERWLANLVTPSELTPAQDLYIGGSFTRARRAAERANCSLYIVSAGLGLLAGSTRVPSYDLTLSPSAPARIQALVTDRFDAHSWWQQMQQGGFSSPIEAIASGEGRILVALTKPYANLIGAALSELPSAIRSRLRIFGSGLEPSLPASLHAQVMPYDTRLNVVVPGTWLDFSARALAHFCELVATHALRDTEADETRVLAALAPATAPVVEARKRISDTQLLKYVTMFVHRGLTKSCALRELREGLGLACEQTRFARLYRSASS